MSDLPRKYSKSCKNQTNGINSYLHYERGRERGDDRYVCKALFRLEMFFLFQIVRCNIKLITFLLSVLFSDRLTRFCYCCIT
jgi:hypothetical protein